MIKDVCQKCKYFDDEGKIDNWGRCKVYPAKCFKCYGGGFTSELPRTNRYSFCKEFKNKKK